MHRKMFAAGLPLSGTIEVTRRCPLTCAHCYNNLPMGDRGAAQRELSFDEHCRLLDEISEAGCLWLLYTGGEIFARRDFIDIYSYARRRGLLITLFTTARSSRRRSPTGSSKNVHSRSRSRSTAGRVRPTSGSRASRVPTIAA